jgi:hypothetical protein
MKGDLSEKIVRVLAAASIILGGALSLSLAGIALAGFETSPAWAIVLFAAYFTAQGVISSSPVRALSITGMLLALGMMILMFGDLLRIRSEYGSLDGTVLHFVFIIGSALIWISLSLKISKRGN